MLFMSYFLYIYIANKPKNHSLLFLNLSLLFSFSQRFKFNRSNRFKSLVLVIYASRDDDRPRQWNIIINRLLGSGFQSRLYSQYF